MNLLPDLKVIHYLRDPRGVINSRIANGYIMPGPLASVVSRPVFKLFNSSFLIERHTEQLCRQMSTDLEISAQLKISYPGRIKTILYEDLAQNPIEIAKQLYQFVGLNLTDEIREYIYSITMAGKQPNGIYATTRTNSSRTAFGWKQRLSLHHIKNIDKHCDQLYKRLGYQKQQSDV